MDRPINIACQSGADMAPPTDYVLPAAHPVTVALQEGIAKLRPAHRRVGWRQGRTERDVRDGKTLPAAALVAVLESNRLAGAPLYGPTGAMQVLDRARFALRVAYREFPAVDLDTASLVETVAQAAVDCLQVRRWERMNAGELVDFAAHAEAHAAALADLAFAARLAARTQEQAASRRADARVRA